MKTIVTLLVLALMCFGLNISFKEIRADIATVAEQVNRIHEQTFDPDYPVSELITVYTSEDILYLQGTRITSESGRLDVTYSARNTAVEMLAQFSADQSNPETH